MIGAMMKTMILDVIGMGEIVVDQMLELNSATYVNVWIQNLISSVEEDSQIKKEEGDVNFQIGKATTLVMMKITMQDVNGIVEIAVDQMLTQDFATNVNVWIQILSG